MSLPSYTDVSDAKATVETVKSLSVEAPKGSSGIVGGTKKQSAPSEMTSKKKEAAAAKQRAREAFEQENMGGKRVETVALSVPSYSESTSKQERSFFSL